jgi:ribosomal protein S21
VNWTDVFGGRVVVIDGDLDRALRAIRGRLYESEAEVRKRRAYFPPAQKRRTKAARARSRARKLARRGPSW